MERLRRAVKYQDIYFKGRLFRNWGQDWRSTPGSTTMNALIRPWGTRRRPRFISAIWRQKAPPLEFEKGVQSDLFGRIRGLDIGVHQAEDADCSETLTNSLGQREYEGSLY